MGALEGKGWVARRDDIDLQDALPKGAGELLSMLLLIASRDSKEPGTRIVRMSNVEIGRKLHWGKKRTLNAIEALSCISINGYRAVEIGKATRSHAKESARPFGIPAYTRKVCSSSVYAFAIGRIERAESE